MTTIHSLINAMKYFVNFTHAKHGKRKDGRPNLTYIDDLNQDTGLEEPDIKTAMLDRSVWLAIPVLTSVSKEE